MKISICTIMLLLLWTNLHGQRDTSNNYYAELKMPAFKRLKQSDRKRLRKECKRLDRYNAAAAKTFLTRLNEMEMMTTQLSKDKTRSDAKNRLVSTIYEIQSELSQLRSKRLSMGMTVFLTGQVALLNQVLSDVNRSGSINQLQQRIVQGVRDNMNYSSLKSMSKIDRYNRKEKQERLMIAGSSFDEVKEDAHSFPSFSDHNMNWIGEADMQSKICAIYAKTVNTNGNNARDIDIDRQYFFSYETAIQAQYKCKTGRCDNFLEQNGLVSANGANIIPSNYVFRFRDKQTNKVYYRCISKEMFEMIQSNPGTGKSRKFRIIFYPDAEECNAFMPR